MNKYQKLCEDLCRNPYNFQLSSEDARAMMNDPNIPDEFKDKLIDIRDKMPTDSDIRTMNHMNYMKMKQNQNELQQQFNELGGFVFAIYQRLGVMFDDKVLSQGDKARLLMMATYLNYEDNKLVYKNGKSIRPNQLGMLLRVTEKTIKLFLTKISNLNLVEIKNNEIYLTKTLFFKGDSGDIEQIKDKDFGYTRVFINTYQYLYETLDSRKLKYLGILYNILGHINFYHNVLVTNDSSETDYKKLKVMTFNEFCDICGKKEKSSRSAYSQFKTALSSIKLENNQPLFAFVRVDNIDKILVNPYVTYMSSNLNTFTETLRVIFENNINDI